MSASLFFFKIFYFIFLKGIHLLMVHCIICIRPQVPNPGPGDLTLCPANFSNLIELIS